MIIIFYYYTRTFIKTQQKYTKLLQLFTSAWRNNNTERKGEKNTSKMSITVCHTRPYMGSHF